MKADGKEHRRAARQSVNGLIGAAILLPVSAAGVGLMPVLLTDGFAIGAGITAAGAVGVAAAALLYRCRRRVATAMAEGGDAVLTAARLEGRLHDAVDSYADGFLLFDADDRLVMANAAMQRMYPIMWRHLRPGRTYEEIMRASMAEGGISAGDVNGEAYIQQRLASHRTPHPPMLRRTPDGRWVEIVDNHTQDGGVVTRLVDMTERIEAEADQKLAEGRLADAIGSMEQGFALFDPDDRLIICNRAYVESYERLEDVIVPGVSYETIMREGSLRGILGDGETTDEFVRRTVERHQRASDIRFDRRTTSGRWMQVLDRRTPTGYIVCLRTDITALKQVQEQLEARVGDLEANQEAMRIQAEELHHLAREIARARDQADTANRAKTDFLAMMSHELRTPLNAILGFSELLRSEIFGALGAPQYLEYSHDIYNSGAHLLSLINDLLDLAKVESGMSQLRETEVPVSLLVDSSLRMVRERAAKGKVRIVDRVAPDLPLLLADERRVIQILVNLLSNAVKFTAEGGTVIISGDRDESGCITIAVADTGIGIPAPALQRVMEPFYQADSTLSRQFEGTGLGLPLARQLAEAHGATLTLQSAIDIGTTARLRFPPSRSIALPLPKIAAAG